MGGPILSPDFIHSPKPNAAAREPIPFAVTPEIRKKNDGVVRDGFFDSKGKARMEKSACGGAYAELKQMCGDPESWKPEDMKRPEIQAYVMAQRTFGVLRDGRPLIKDEVEIINLLLNRQQEINVQKLDALQKDAKIQSIMAASGMGAKIESEMVQNQTEINMIHKAMEQGISTVDERTAQGTNGVTASWAEPGKDMSSALTASIVKLYDHSLRMTDAERAAVKYPSEPLRSPMTPEQQLALTEQIKAFEIAEIARRAQAQAQKQNGDEKVLPKEDAQTASAPKSAEPSGDEPVDPISELMDRLKKAA